MSENKRLWQTASGFVPGGEYVLKKTMKQPPLYSTVRIVPSEEEMRSTLEDLKIRRNFTKFSNTIHRYLQVYPEWRRNHQACISEAKNLADEMDNHHRNVNGAHIFTSVFGIGGGVASIVGLALIPVTFRTSLGLTIAGAAVGGLATVGGSGASAADLYLRKKCLDKAKNAILKHEKCAEEMRKIIDEVNDNATKVAECATEEIIRCLSGPSNRDDGERFRHGIAITAKIILLIDDIRKIFQAAKALHLHRTGAGLETVCRASCYSARVVTKITSEGARGASKVALTTTGRVFARAGYVFSGIGILIDGVTMAASIYSLGKGSTTSASEILREAITEMQKEIKYADEMYDILKCHFKK